MASSISIPSVKIAIIGTGVIGPRHADSVLASTDTELLCIVDPSPHATTIAGKYKVPLYTCIEHMLSTSPSRPDAAIVCTPNTTHVALSTTLLAAGIHVLCEKPISTSIASARALITSASSPTTNSKNAKLLIGHHRRFNPTVLAAKRLLTASSPSPLGHILAVSGLWCTHKPASYFAPPTAWRASASQGGGPILINLIHDIDILHFLLGPIVRVHAEQTISTRSGEHDIEEGAAILLRFQSGVVGTFILSDALPSAHNFEAATGENPMIPRADVAAGRDIYRIFGTEGVLSVGDGVLTRVAQGEEKSWSSRLVGEEIKAGEEVPFDEQLEHFVRVARGEEEPGCKGEDGLRALVVCEAVREALKTGQAVDVKVE